MKNWKVGERLSTVLNYPVLMQGTTPMHVMLEVVEVIKLEGTLVPKVKAIGLRPVEDQEEIKKILQDNRDFPPNTLRLMLKRSHDEMNETMEALNYFQQNLLEDFDAALQYQAAIMQQEAEKRRNMGNPTRQQPFDNTRRKV